MTLVAREDPVEAVKGGSSGHVVLAEPDGVVRTGRELALGALTTDL